MGSSTVRQRIAFQVLGGTLVAVGLALVTVVIWLYDTSPQVLVTNESCTPTDPPRCLVGFDWNGRHHTYEIGRTESGDRPPDLTVGGRNLLKVYHGHVLGTGLVALGITGFATLVGGMVILEFLVHRRPRRAAVRLLGGGPFSVARPGGAAPTAYRPPGAWSQHGVPGPARAPRQNAVPWRGPPIRYGVPARSWPGGSGVGPAGTPTRRSWLGLTSAGWLAGARWLALFMVASGVMMIVVVFEFDRLTPRVRATNETCVPSPARCVAGWDDASGQHHAGVIGPSHRQGDDRELYPGAVNRIPVRGGHVADIPAGLVATGLLLVAVGTAVLILTRSGPEWLALGDGLAF